MQRAFGILTRGFFEIHVLANIPLQYFVKNVRSFKKESSGIRTSYQGKKELDSLNWILQGEAIKEAGNRRIL